jgi:hypothetical protein
MRKFISIPVFLMLLCCGKAVHAQSYNDTTIEEQKIVSDDNVYERGKELDTSLYFHEHKMPEDSIASWKRNRSFAYINYLDSLLKIKEQKAAAASGKKKGGSSSPSSNPSSSSSTVVEQPPGAPSGSTVLSAGWLPYVLWTLAAGFVLFILYNLFLKDTIFKRRQKAIASTNEEPTAEEESITWESDFQRLIRVAATAGNYRLAVRYQYLQSLHFLSGKNYVQLAADKTNYQYVHEIKNEPLRNDFASLTLNYEYAWYGEFQIEQGLYQKLDSAFASFNQRI